MDAPTLIRQHDHPDFIPWILSLVDQFEQPGFIENDPISVPHRFSKKQDQEISALFASLFAWGQRKTIINKSNELMHRMDDAPYDFIKNLQQQDLRVLSHFVHRTFNEDDLIGLLSFLHEWYQHHDSLEDAFIIDGPWNISDSLIGFHQHVVTEPAFMKRTHKHIPSVAKGSTAKRLVMFLRWMVRSNEKGVDFGLWNRIPSSGLALPLDVHVARMAEQMNILKQKPSYHWNDVLFLQSFFQKIDFQDPGKFDFALFGLGVKTQ